MNIKIDIKYYTNNLLEKTDSINGLLNEDKKIIKYKKDKEEVIINFKNTPIIKKEDDEKRIIISSSKIKIFINEINNDIILPVKDFKFSIKDKKIEIMYYIEDSKENKKIEIIYKEEKHAK